jgi:hypothetical protein
MYAHLAHLGLDHRDVRYSNILRRIVYSDAAPSAYCSLHNCVHDYHFRIIDFDRTIKDDYVFKHRESAQWVWAARLLEGMASGFVVEPWDL